MVFLSIILWQQFTMTRKVFNNLNGYTSLNSVQLIRGGSPYFDLLESLIDRAKQSIHLQVYIYKDDETGIRITNALCRSARRGVSVYLLLDGYASRTISDETILNFKAAGIHFRRFMPLLKGRNFYVGRRLHHKIFVADGTSSLVGGINISDQYNDLPGKPAWLDWAVYVKGEASTLLYNRCKQVWNKKLRLPVSTSILSPMVLDTDCHIRVRINDWVLNKNQISRSYLEMFHRAESQITIMSSYFMPGRVFRRNLSQAAKRGVQIRVILTKVSDVKIAKLAERFFYSWLLKRNIEVYEYRDRIVHSKIATYDQQWVTIGSFNFNDISAYASVELNLDIQNKSFAQQLDQTLDNIIANDCDQITNESFDLKTDLWHRFLYRMAFVIIRSLFFLFTFYIKQEKVK